MPVKNRIVGALHAVGRDDRECTLTSWLFLRLLALIYLFAFGSLWPQIPGLLGHNGILPAADFLRSVQGSPGSRGFLLVPTLAWWNASDTFLTGLCVAGVVLSLLLLVDVLTTPALVGLWICWLSLVNIGQDFLSYQWDTLLLEAGFLAIFLLPGGDFLPRSPRRSPAPSSVILWLLRWLLFRLMFFSGVVKLASGDPVWHSLSALRFHYQTQPLPTLLSWYAHKFPAWFHTLETAAVFVLELAVPFLIFVPGQAPRRLAFFLLAALQVLILLTGNYAFFNLLTLALCVLLLTDDDLRGAVPRRLRPVPAETESRSATVPQSPWRGVFVAPVTALIGLLSAVQVSSAFLPELPVPEPARLVAERVEPLHVFNSYGLFAVMTTRRYEIIVEGSRDGRTWTEYAFRYKPGDVRRAPRWVWPHQPRLDWQMWFAALGGPEGRPDWFPVFLQRLLQGSPEVLGLMAENPFGRTPPRYVRALLYGYTFSSDADRRTSGVWWRRRLLETYYPAVSLKEADRGVRVSAPW